MPASFILSDPRRSASWSLGWSWGYRSVGESALELWRMGGVGNTFCAEYWSTTPMAGGMVV